MEETERKVEKQGNRTLLYSVVKWTLITMPVPAILALIGIILGAINFASPTHYPPSIIAAWFTGDILLVAYALAHIVLLVFMSMEAMSESDSVTMIPVSIIGMLIVLVGSGLAIGGRHLAWIALLIFLGLIAFAVGDVMFLTTRRK